MDLIVVFYINKRNSEFRRHEVQTTKCTKLALSALFCTTMYSVFIEDISKLTVSNKMCNKETVKLLVLLVFCIQKYYFVPGQSSMCIKLHTQHTNEMKLKTWGMSLLLTLFQLLKLRPIQSLKSYIRKYCTSDQQCQGVSSTPAYSYW